MPIFDYRCTECKRAVEVFQRDRDEKQFPCATVYLDMPAQTWTSCPPDEPLPVRHCHGTMRRVMSAASIPPSGAYSYGK